MNWEEHPRNEAIMQAVSEKKYGKFMYPNHHIMKKNRLKALEREDNKCEICGNLAAICHHIDRSTDNHDLSNLQALCYKCHRKLHPRLNTNKDREMCQFMSGIGMKNGDLHTSIYTDSHEDIIEDLGLNNNGNQFQRLEYLPQGDLWDYKKYELEIDGAREEWVTDELLEKWERKFITRLKKMIIDSDKNILLGGKYILKGDIVINKLVSSTIEDAGLCTIEDAGHSTIENK